MLGYDYDKDIPLTSYIHQLNFINLMWLCTFYCVVAGVMVQPHADIFSMSNTKLGQGFCDDSGVRTHSYDCPTHTEYVNHLLYV